MKAFRHPVTHRILGIALGATFVYASVDKIAHPPEFARIVYHYQIVGPSARIPPVLPNTFAVVLPWIELVIGALLIGDLWRREAAALASLLLVVFLGAVGSAMYRGIDIEKCGCFSVSDAGRKAGWLLLAEDAALLAAALVLAGAQPRSRAPAPTSEPLGATSNVVDK